MTDVTVTVLDPSTELRLHRLTGAFLAGYQNANTRASYLQQLHRWFAWWTYTGGGVYNPNHPTGGHYDHIHVSVRRQSG